MTRSGGWAYNRGVKIVCGKCRSIFDAERAREEYCAGCEPAHTQRQRNATRRGRAVNAERSPRTAIRRVEAKRSASAPA